MRYVELTKPQLEAQLRARDLPLGGSKPDLVERLEAAEPSWIRGLTREELRRALRQRELSVSGIKDELVERLAGAVRSERAEDATHEADTLAGHATREPAPAGPSEQRAEQAARQAPDGVEDAVTDVAEDVVSDAFGHVTRAAQQLVDTLGERGVRMDRILASFRTYGETPEGEVGDRMRGAADTAEDQAEAAGNGVQRGADETESLVEALRARGVTVGGEPDGPTSTSVRSRAPWIVRRAASQLELLAGRRVDGVSALAPADEGWRLALELVEVARIPPSTDVLGTYEVVLDADGDLLHFERTRRYVRGQIEDGA